MRFSASQLGTWSKCQMQWAYRYLDGLKVPPGIAAYLGKSVDAAVTADLDHKRTRGKLLTTDAICQVASDEAGKVWEEEPPRVDDSDKIQHVGELKDAAISLSLLHHARVAPGIDPEELQAERTIAPEGYDFAVLGYIDVLEADKIRDTKTTGKKPPADAADRGNYADQLTIYSAMEPDRSTELNYLVNTARPYTETRYGSPRSKNDAAKVWDKMQRMVDSIRAGIFHPAPSDSWQCSAKWCGYYEQCPHGARDVKMIPVSRLRAEAGGTWGE